MTTPERRVVQDDIRERQLADLLRLERSAGRTGSDARDESGNRYELKTTTRGGVTTGRDLGLDYLERMRRSYLICARGQQGLTFRFEEIYFLAPSMMQTWIDIYYLRLTTDRDLVESALETLAAAAFPGDITRLRQICYRGFTINNPKIPWKYVHDHGVRLEDEPALHLRQLIAIHPLPSQT